MSPESFDADKAHKKSIDRWAFGVILNELISEQVPYPEYRDAN